MTLKMQKIATLIFLLFMLPMAVANEIVVAIPEPEAPYFNRLKDTGAEFDIIHAALKHAGYSVIPYYLEYKYIPDALKSGDIDCATSLTPYKGLNSFYSAPLVEHPFVAISLAKNKIVLKTIADLKTIDFVAFLGASEELDEAYKQLIKQKKMRPEETNATKMVNMLFREEVSVIIMDKNIFMYSRSMFRERPERKQVVKYHALFTPLAYPLTCKKETVSKKFNQSLRILKENGQYQTILKRYFN